MEQHGARFAFEACVDRPAAQDDGIHQAARHDIQADDQRGKRHANLRRFIQGSVPAERAECLSQTLGKGQRSAAACCENQREHVSIVTKI
jgi:hypothetical protein